MASILLVTDGSLSAQTAAHDPIVSQRAVVVPPDRVDAHDTTNFSACIFPVALVQRRAASCAPASCIAYGADLHMERALMVGCADYLCDPWTPVELMNRVRREQRNRDRRVLGSVIALEDRNVTLTAVQIAIWTTLEANIGKIVDRRVLAAAAGIGEGSAAPENSRALDMQIARLRRSLGAVGERIETVRGRGYRLRAEIVKNSNLIVDK